MNISDQIEYVPLGATDTPPIFIARLAMGSFSTPPRRPHRHMFHELIWVQSGSGRHTIDDQSFSLIQHTLALITQGQVHVFEQSSNLAGYYLRFTDAFLHPSSQGCGSTNMLFNHLIGNGALIVPPDEIGDIDSLVTLLASEYTCENNAVKYTILRHLLSALLLRVDRINRALHHPKQVASDTNYVLYQHFLRELERGFMAHHDVGYYANALHLTPSQLAQLLQQMGGKPTKRLILERIMVEARRYLDFTELSVKEIAAQLGYSDPFHFSKVFKQEIGLSPYIYRDQRNEK